MTLAITSLKRGGAIAFCVCIAVTQRAQNTGAWGEPQNEPAAAVTGTVVDMNSGRPIEGAIVRLAMRLGAQPGGRAPLAVRTDPQGRFVFVGLRDGAYSLIATKPGYGDAAYGGSPLTIPSESLVLARHDWF